LDNKDSFLLKQIASANKAQVETADVCLENIFKICSNPKLINGLIDGSNSKNNYVRTCCQKYMSIILSNWNFTEYKNEE